MEFISRLPKTSVALLFLACACTTPAEPEPLPPLTLTAEELAEWGTETISLPPGFAPDLPSGTETLRFSPGWRDPESEGFWSYVFAMQIDEAAPDAERLDEILELYYDGLIAAVGGEKVSENPATAEVERTASDHFNARIQFPDAFGDLRPIDLGMQVKVIESSSASTTLHILASPQPADHPIWRTLDAVVKTIDL